MISLCACTTTKEITEAKPYSDFKIVNTPFKVENDSISLHELRFYKIQSAMDAMKLMYQNYGKWNRKINSKHQQNIKRIIWQNIELIDGDQKTFTVIADGTETMTNYFACLMVFDSEENDCLKIGHPYREKLTELFVNRMSSMDKKTSVYRLFR